MGIAFGIVLAVLILGILEVGGELLIEAMDHLEPLIRKINRL